ncbi:MAG TPA: thioredoxin domain-containing protein [Miltoncostaeaceae bacterium]|nr:thioredoxin domain-containing protein [Miltoncostaeaceae bacterium]
MKKEYWIGIVVAALVVVGIVVGVSLAGGGDDDAPSSITGTEEVQAQLEGVPQAGNVLGDPEAPVEIIEYGDLACPACREASTTTIPEAIDQIVKPGDAKLVFRPIAFISRSSERGALGAEAAGMQDAMWSFVELIYRNQGSESDQDWLTDDLMTQAVEQLGLDVDQWTADYMGQESEQKFLATESQAQEDEVGVTPTFLIRGPNGEKTVTGAVEVSELQDAVAEVGPQT